LSGLNNPISLAFTSGELLAHPEDDYLFVLEQGDLDLRFIRERRG
jgi:hypothetical protein